MRLSNTTKGRNVLQKKYLKAMAMTVAVGFVAASCGSDAKTATSASTKASTAATTAATTAGTTAATTAGPVATTAGPVATTAGTAATTAAGGDLTALVAACKKEGKVNLIALPDSWANYKGILQSFRDKYPGVQNPVASPDITSKEEQDAVVNLAGQADMPDSVDVSPAIAQSMVDAGLFAPYTPTVAGQLPAGLQDTNHNWVAAYYGIMSILTNTTIVKNAPKTFADLKKPEYKGLVALNGDPRKAGAAFAAVMAASLANGGSADDILPGIKYFADLKKSGNLGATDVTPATMLSGETPIAIDWSYNLPGLADKLKAAGLTVETSFPSDGVYGGFYAQGVVKNSPHQACSKLWLEHILSDEGALGYLAGGAMPARFAELVKAGKVTAELKKNLPPDNLVAQIKFLTPAQIAKAKDILGANWGPMVADA